MIDLIFFIIFGILTFVLYELIKYNNVNDTNIDNNDKNIDKSNCNLENFDIDDMYIIKRVKEYEKYINKLIDKYKNILTEDEIKILKNKIQFYNIKDRQNIKNISNCIYKDNIKDLLKSTMNINDPEEDVPINDPKLLENQNYFDTINSMNSKINENEPNCDNIQVLKDEDYLKNYYIDIFGNRINAELKDYFSDYYAEINNDMDKDKCIKVNSKNIGNYMFIPDQFNTQKYLTNAYNIDYNRIVNPWTIY
jgi:hypothetical protein